MSGRTAREEAAMTISMRARRSRRGRARDGDRHRARDARRFAAAGAFSCSWNHQDEPNRRLVADLTEQGVQVEALAVDLRDRDATDACVAETAARHGKVDVLVNNAGRCWSAWLDELTLAAWDETHDLHLRAPAPSSSVLPALRASGAASVINNASIDGVFGHPLMASLWNGKGGLVALTRNFAYGLAATTSGSLPRDGASRRRCSTGSRTAHGRSGANAPLRRLGTAEEVAEVMLLLANSGIVVHHGCGPDG